MFAAGKALTKAAAAAPVVLTDTFNRADRTTNLGTPSGGGSWVARAGIMGISSNTAYGATSNVMNEVTHGTVMGSDNMSVSMTVGTLGAGAGGTFVTLGSDTVGERAYGYVNSSGASIWSATGWESVGEVKRAGYVAYTPTLGDVILFHRIGNVYSLVKNGTTVLCQWTDSGNILPRNSTHRLVGCGAYNASGNTWFDIDKWDAEQDPAALPFTPISEENTNRTNQAVPVGATEYRVTLIGGGGGGGSSYRDSAGIQRQGGTGGGGAAAIQGAWRPVSELGSTYSVARGLKGTGGPGRNNGLAGFAGGNGGNSTFTSGSVSMTAGAGFGGSGGTSTNGASTAAAGGTASVSGTSGATTGNGTASGTTANTANAVAAPNNSGIGAAGGGCGGGISGSNTLRAGSNGGNTPTQTGGTGTAASVSSINLIGGAGPASAAGVAGAGAGGGGAGSSSSNSSAGGVAAGYGAGGGGGGSRQDGTAVSASTSGGAGGDGYTLVQFR